MVYNGKLHENHLIRATTNCAKRAQKTNFNTFNIESYLIN